MSKRFATGALIITAALAVLVSCSKREKGVILGKEPLERVFKIEDNVDALAVWAQEKAKAAYLIHIDPSDDIAVFPVSHAESMKNAAMHLKRGNTAILRDIRPVVERGGVLNIGRMAGFFKEVIWVMPTGTLSSSIKLEDVKRFLVERRGYHEAALGELRQVGGRVEGKLAGIPITITSLDSLVAPPEPAIVDIDLAYFVATKAISPGFRTGTASTVAFLKELSSKGIRSSLVTINLSNSNKICPMDLRFLGALITDALSHPEKLKGENPEKWRLMAQAEDHLVKKDYKEAEATYSRLTEEYPNDAGLHFALAVTKGFMEKGIESREELLKAMQIDGGYLSGFFQLARVLAAQDKIKTGEEILETPYLVKILSDVERNYQKGIFYMVGHRPFDALTYLSKVAQIRPDDFSLQSLLYGLYREVGNDRMAVLSLEKLRKIDNARVIREMPWVYKVLGELYDKTKVYGNAADMYRIYLQIAPNDTSAARLKKRIAEIEEMLKGTP